MLVPEAPREPEDWEKNIRTDLWHEMTVNQLNIQRDLVVEKISLLHKYGISHQTAYDILCVLQRSLEHLNERIDHKMDPKYRNLT